MALTTLAKRNYLSDDYSSEDFSDLFRDSLFCQPDLIVNLLKKEVISTAKSASKVAKYTAKIQAQELLVRQAKKRIVHPLQQLECHHFFTRNQNVI